jgi:hypothetical protein
MDDAGDEKHKPSFWEKLWGFIKDVAPKILPVVASAILNPSSGHIEHVGHTEAEGIRPDMLIKVDKHGLSDIDPGFLCAEINPDVYAALRPESKHKDGASLFSSTF